MPFLTRTGAMSARAFGFGFGGPPTKFNISPAVSGKTVWDLKLDGPLTLVGGTWTITPIGGPVKANLSISGGAGGAGGGNTGFQGGTGVTITGVVTLPNTGGGITFISASAGPNWYSPGTTGGGGTGGGNASFTGAAGGGYSGIRQGATDWFALAGGGAGGGFGGKGGGAGVTVGQTGQQWNIDAPPGQGGTQTAGGSGANPGTSGSAGNTPAGHFGGAGGNGYYGGGSGNDDGSGGSGGGGGSSFTGATHISGVVATPGVLGGNTGSVNPTAGSITLSLP